MATNHKSKKVPYVCVCRAGLGRVCQACPLSRSANVTTHQEFMHLDTKLLAFRHACLHMRSVCGGLFVGKNEQQSKNTCGVDSQ